MISGCQTSTEKKSEKVEPKAEITEYFIVISANEVDSRKINIEINTNFPDETIMRLSLNRTHTLKGSEKEYSGGIFDELFSVYEGKYSKIVEINDLDWYNEHLSLVKNLPNDFQPIDKISDNVNISVLFTPAVKQPENVLKTLGEFSEFISGEGVEKFGKMNIFRVKKEYYLPFEK
jgi:hypothetical protein